MQGIAVPFLRTDVRGYFLKNGDIYRGQEGRKIVISKDRVIRVIDYKSNGKKEVTTYPTTSWNFHWEPFAGIASSIASELYYSEKYGTWMGKNFELYKLTWGGNVIAGGKNIFGKAWHNRIEWVGRGFGAWNAFSIEQDRRNGEVGTAMTIIEQGSNLYSTFGYYGGAWGIGWELGRVVTSLDVYQEFKFNYWYKQMENSIGAPNQWNEDLWYDFFKYY